jgi:hypothetical protein
VEKRFNLPLIEVDVEGLNGRIYPSDEMDR